MEGGGEAETEIGSVHRAKSQARIWEHVEQGQNIKKRVQHLVKLRGAPRQLWVDKE